MRIETAGENAVIVYLGEGQSPEVSQRVQQAACGLERVMDASLVDLVPSYASLLVIFNPLHTDHLTVKGRIQTVLRQLTEGGPDAGTLVNLPVYYSTGSGPDLEDLANRVDLSIENVIEIHQQREYRVYAIGFAPGFAYLGEVDQRIATPRLATPRPRVPRGAVAIADAQTAVYPVASPGGWNLIGACPTQMFDPAAQPSMPVRVGDRVRFEAIGKSRYLALGGAL